MLKTANNEKAKNKNQKKKMKKRKYKGKTKKGKNGNANIFSLLQLLGSSPLKLEVKLSVALYIVMGGYM